MLIRARRRASGTATATRRAWRARGQLLDALVAADEFPEFLTLAAYEEL